MSRLVILVILLGGMRLILPLGSLGLGSQALLTFGFLILAAYSVGELATKFRIPKIVGYLVAGMIFGPSAIAVFDSEAVARLSTVSDLAIALIAFLAGAELRWSEVRDRGVLLLKLMSSELLIGFIAISSVILLLHEFIPILQGAPLPQLLAFTILFASIAIVHSPAVTIALLSETRARGIVARTTLGVVLLADVAVVLLFSITLTIARALAPTPGAAGMSALAVIWEIGGAVIVGAIIGAGVAAYLRFVGRELMLFAVLVCFFAIEIAHLAHVELLLMLLTSGFIAENFSEQGDQLRHAMERSAAPVFVVFFALSGAKIDIMQLLPLLPLVVPIALVRAGAIWTGLRVGARWGNAGEQEKRLVWMGLVSQAGVAIGLSSIVAEAYPAMGAQLRGMLLALIAINETVGPILFRRALTVSGEDVAGSDESASPPVAAVAH